MTVYMYAHGARSPARATRPRQCPRPHAARPRVAAVIQLPMQWHTMHFAALLALAEGTLTARAAPHSHDYDQVRLPNISDHLYAILRRREHPTSHH